MTWTRGFPAVSRTQKRGQMILNKKAVIGVAAGVLAAVVGVTVFLQLPRLRAVFSVAKSATMNEEQVATKNEENTQFEQEIQSQYQVPDIQLTPEMQAALADGSMSLEEAAQQFLSAPTSDAAAETSEPDSEPADNGNTQPAEPTDSDSTKPADNGSTKPAEPADNGSTKPVEPADNKPADTGSTKPADNGSTKPADSGSTKPAEPADTGTTQAAETPAPPVQSAEEKAREEANARAQNLFAQLYVLQSSFSSRLDSFLAGCIEEFLALEPEKQTNAMKFRIVYSKMDTIEAMEAECDSQVEQIALELDSIDPELGAKARQYYQNQKELKKASIIAQYGGGG